MIQPIDSDFSSILEEVGSTISLNHLQLVRAFGADAENFIQGQFSNDISTLENGEVQLNAYCNPKGRALALIYVMRHAEDGFWLLLPKDLAAVIIKRLQMYVMRSKVTFETPDDHTAIGIVGTPAEHAEKSFTFDSHIPRNILISPNVEVETSEMLSAPRLDSAYWRLMDILSGIPQVFASTSEAFIPQHINLELVGGVSFRKGCYPGQEIVARLKYLGKSKQRLAIARARSATTVEAGIELFHQKRPDQKAGIVVDAVQTAQHQYHLTFTTAWSESGHGNVQLGSADGPKLEFLPLPYEIPME